MRIDDNNGTIPHMSAKLGHPFRFFIKIAAFRFVGIGNP